MLKPALIAMSLMGCDCDAVLCVPLERQGPTFASLDACEAATAAAIAAETGHDYPLLTASCRAAEEPVDAMVASSEDGGAVLAQAGDQPAVEGKAGLLDGGLALAGGAGRYLLYRTGDGMVAVRQGFGTVFGNVGSVAIGALDWIHTRRTLLGS